MVQVGRRIFHTGRYHPSYWIPRQAGEEWAQAGRCAPLLEEALFAKFVRGGAGNLECQFLGCARVGARAGASPEQLAIRDTVETELRPDHRVGHVVSRGLVR